MAKLLFTRPAPYNGRPSGPAPGVGGSKLTSRMRSRCTVLLCIHSKERERFVVSRCSRPAEALKLRGLRKFGSKNEASGFNPAMPAAVKKDEFAAEELSGTNGKTNSGCTVRADRIFALLSVKETPTSGLPAELKAWFRRSIGVRA